MGWMADRFKVWLLKEPIVVSSCLIASVGIFFPLVVRPILDSFETAEQVPQPALDDVVAGVTSKRSD